MTELAKLLNQRGHEVTKEGSKREILLPISDESKVAVAFEELLYASLRKDSLRKSWRDWAYDNASINESHRRQIEAYVTLCKAYGATSEFPRAKHQRYAKTFEWYISTLLLREFGARASGFSIRLKDANPDDEFDCIAIVDRGLVYVECKTGQGQVFDDLEKISRRDQELRADYTFYILDRDYTFQSGAEEDLPSLTKAQADALHITDIERITSPDGSTRFISFAGESRQFFICTTTRLDKQIRHAIRYYNAYTEGNLFSRQRPADYSHETISFADPTSDS